MSSIYAGLDGDPTLIASLKTLRGADKYHMEICK